MPRIFYFALSLAPLFLLKSNISDQDNASGEQIVQLWFERMNALDSSRDSENSLIELYSANGQHITSPTENQLGATTFDGPDHIRQMIQRFVSQYSNPQFRIDVATAREQSKTMFHTTEGPWGGQSIAVAYTASVTRRSDGVRLMVPGAAFFRLAENKIYRSRLYIASGEQAEVELLN